MRSALLLILAFATLSTGCASLDAYGALAIEKRRQINDAQARLMMAATCDIAVGSYFRELSDTERRFAGLVCGGQLPEVPTLPHELPARSRPDLPAQLRAPQR